MKKRNKSNIKEIWSDYRYGTCKFCDGAIIHPGLDAYFCSTPSCGWQKTEWGQVYYEEKEKEAEEKKAMRREERKAQKEADKRRDKKTWEESSGMTQLDIFEYQID